MESPPTGTVTFLFTDIEGSTRRWQDEPEAMRALLVEHDAIFRDVIDKHRGHLFKHTGDGVAAVFSSAADACAAAVDAQTRLVGVLPVRMGLHTGEAELRDGDYFGSTLNRCARLMGIAHGGQIVASGATAGLVRDRDDLRDLGEHRLRDLSRAERVWQVCGGAFPALRSVDAVPTNLPTVRTELIGRGDEVESLGRLVESEQLVTLTGVGGVGKTRLALAVAASVSAAYPDGCWLVELSPVANGTEVVNTVAAALLAPITTTDALARYLFDRRVLLVLDNCEHVLDAVADLVDAVLSASPEVHVVVTSREPLGLDGEQVRRVVSLATPDADATLDDAAASAAVQLFCDRAAAQAADFVLDDRNVAAVVEICRHLDGIPLAIELAAARVRGMAPGEIARRLDERFRLLGGGSRRAQERHRTLFATVLWSYDLLTDDEKAVFGRVAVFPASFELAAAEAVAGDVGTDVVDCVLRLVDRSLVVYESDTNRYRLLETLRQFGLDRLAETGETEATRARHAEHFLALARRMHPHIRDARYQAAYPLLLAELDNFRGVADWCAEQARWVELVGMSRDLFFFLLDAAAVDCARWHRAVVDHSDAFDGQTIADSLGELAWISVTNLGDYPAANGFAEQSIVAAAGAGLLPSPWVFCARAMLDAYTGGLADGPRFAELGITAATERGDEIAAANALGMRSNFLALTDPVTARDSVREAVRRARECGMQSLVISTCVNAATVHGILATDFADALSFLEAAPTMPVEATNTLYLNLIWAHVLVRARAPGAVSRLAFALRVADRLQSPNAQDYTLRLLAICASEAGLVAEAATLAAYANATFEPFRMRNLGADTDERFEAVLSTDPDRAAYEEAGAAATRRQILDLVKRIEAGFVVLEAAV